jgi:hypothetical protein
MYTTFWYGTEHLGDIGVDARMPGHFVKKDAMKRDPRIKWLRIGLDGGVLWTRSHTLGFVQNMEFVDLLSNYQFFNDTVPPTSQNTNSDRLNFNSAT